ncbi:D-cysteine desulfhydrase [Brassicibacter mesophilus]
MECEVDKMIKLPDSMQFANLPTKIERLDRLSTELGDVELYIKRDDQTGTEFSGNKIRKLEFVIKEAIDQDCDYLITCGGVQSNHARATAAIAARLGLKSYLVLRGTGEEGIDSNYFLDKVLGASIKFITPEDYKERRIEIMTELAERLSTQGHKAYVIPEGASNGIGTFGYYKALEEILKQEEQLGFKFDAIVTAIGSGGTYAGLFYANKVNENTAKIFGINVCDDAEYFKNQISNILKDSFTYTRKEISFLKDDINIIDGYVGVGYAMSRPEEIEFIHKVAKLEGIILDPVYTGKAMYGLVEEIKKGTLKGYNKILFIHTGGLFGLFPKKDLFSF